MSSNCLPGSVTSFCSSIVTTARPVRVFEVISSIFEFSDIASSTRRLTSSSTFVALAPGQGTMTRAARTGMSGSLRWGIER
jgi:hypothetical protein